jgi:hypothetical protein
MAGFSVHEADDHGVCVTVQATAEVLQALRNLTFTDIDSLVTE